MGKILGAPHYVSPRDNSRRLCKYVPRPRNQTSKDIVIKKKVKCESLSTCSEFEYVQIKTNRKENKFPEIIFCTFLFGNKRDDKRPNIILILCYHYITLIGVYIFYMTVKLKKIYFF